jgi:hypothetical protein
MKKLYLSLLLAILCIGPTLSQNIPDSAAYLGQTLPGTTRKIFDITPDPGYSAVEKIAISPDGTEIYFEETNNYWTSFRFKYYKYENNTWNGPSPLFSNFYCLSLSPDGEHLYFENNSYKDCWMSYRTATGWAPPSRFLSSFQVHSLNETDSGKFYFSSHPTQGLGQFDICKLVVSNSDTTLLGLGTPVNSGFNEGDFFLSNDESFMIFMSNRPGGYGITDLYISFKDSSGTWTNPQTLGTRVNTSGDDFGPYVTADNKFLFYESGYSSPSSIYWVKIDDLIDSLRTVIFTGIYNSSEFFGKNFQVVPNPANNRINILFDGKSFNDITVGIMSAEGKLVFSETYHNLSRITVDLSGIPKGIYLVNVHTNREQFSKKVILE